MPYQSATKSEQLATTGSARLWRVYCAAFAVALAFFTLSVAPGVVWQDNGVAQVRVLQRDLLGQRGLALSHPLYYVLAIAFQVLPFGESALRTNLVSVLFGTITVANVCLLLRLLTGRADGAAIGALTLAAAHTFWQHCALPETYTLTTALLSAELLCLYQHFTTGQPRWLVLLYLLNGLGVSNHLLAALSLACYLPLTLWLLWRGCLRARVLPWLALVWLAGASLYLTLIVAQIAGGADASATVRSALFGHSWAHSVLNLLPSRRQLINSVLYLGLNFPTPGVLLLIPGLLALYSHRLKPMRTMLLALLAVHLIWAVRYEIVDQYTFFVPSVVLLAIVMGCGAGRFIAGRSRRWTSVLVVTGLFPIAVYAVLPGLARDAKLRLSLSRTVPYRDEYSYFLRPWKTGYHGAEHFARELRETLPENAVLIVDGTTAPPIHYLQLTGRWRDDLRVFPSPEPRRDPQGQSLEKWLADELAQGLVFVVTPGPGYCPRWLFEQYEFTQEGLVHRVVGRRPSQPDPPGDDDAP